PSAMPNAASTARAAWPGACVSGPTGASPTGACWIWLMIGLVLRGPLRCSDAGRMVAASASGKPPEASPDLAGVQEAERVERGLHAPGQRHHVLSELVLDPAPLQDADAVLAGEGAAEGDRGAEQL